MKKNPVFILLGFGCWLLSFSTIQAGDLQKLAQTGMKFLSVSTDARASAMGEAATTMEGHSSSLFFNPAGIASLQGLADVSVGQVNWIADIKYVFGSVALNPWRGKLGVFGLSMLSADYGTFKGTIRSTNEQGFVDTGTFSPDAIMLGLGYAHALTDRFAVGGHLKYVRQDLGKSIVGFNANQEYIEKSYARDVVAYDFGVIYRTGFKSLNFGMCIRNFAPEVKYIDEGFQLPLTFKIGLSMNLFDLMLFQQSDVHQLLLAVDAIHPRDYPEQINLGCEYQFMKMFALRVGYATPNDEHGFSAGFGFRPAYQNYGLQLDYSYTPFDLFKDVHRFSVHFSF
ncbi:PorV/PorQ family protein [candidate division KSB1 bacterium]|nr:PorV/PorQ family protein [candidate division KSB1 bacterium]